MNILRRLFKKTPPKIATIDEQIQSMALQSNEQLSALATTSNDDVLREAAIAKMSYGNELLGLMAVTYSTRIQTAVRKRLGQLLDDKTITLAQLTAEIPTQLEQMLAVSCSAATSLTLMEMITDSDLLLKLASEANTTQIRQAAAAKISSRDQLEQLVKTVQNKDKNVFKLAKIKLDLFKLEDAKRAELETLAENICIKLEKHSHQEIDVVFKARLVVLQQEWQALGVETSAAMSARYLQAINNCHTKIAARADAIAQQEERVVLDNQALTLAQSALESAKKMMLDVYSAQHVDDVIASNYEHKLQELEQAIRLAANRNLPMDLLNKEFDYSKKHTLSLIEYIKNSGTLAQLTTQLQNIEDLELARNAKHKLNHLLKYAHEFTALPELVVNAQAALKTWNSERNAAEQTAKNVLREYSELIRKGLWSVEQGFARKARAIQKELNEKRLQFVEMPKAMQAKLEEFEQQLNKLGDWHEFAVTPKKEALIVQIQGLIGSKMAPENLATKIHELQDNWKEVSKGGQQQDENLWQQFYQASEQAFAPCKEFFNAQAIEREKNLLKRQDMVVQLQQYLANYHWQSADWSSVEKTLKVARQEWQLCWPVPRKAGNDLQQIFESVMEQLFAKITSEHENNKLAKQQLIEKAQALVEFTDIRDAIDTVKTLQLQWKTIGKSWYKEDQQLWQNFRLHCDAIFARRHQESEIAASQRQAVQVHAEALLAKLDAFLAFSFNELMAAKSDIDAVKVEFFSLQLPRNSTKLLNEKLNTTLSAIATKLEQERNKAELQSWLDMFSVCDAIGDYEVAVIAAKPKAELELQKQSVATLMASIPRWPTGSANILQQRFGNSDNITIQDQIINTENLRTLTIRAEILTGKETPECDKALRMNYQVQQMQQTFGNRDTSIESLILEWIAIAAVAPLTYSELLGRFNYCRESGVNQ